MGIAWGVAAGAATLVVANALHNREPARTAAGSDGRVAGIAFVMALGVGVASWFDKGRILQDNAAANRRLRDAFERDRASAIAENDRRRRDVRARVTINAEAR